MQLNRHRTRILLVAGDALAVLLANILALALRFDFKWSSITEPAFRATELLLIDVVLTPLVFLAMGLYQRYWKHMSLDDLLRRLRALLIRARAAVRLFAPRGTV